MIAEWTLRRSPGEGNGNPLLYSCLENPIDREAWLATVHKGHKPLDMTERQYAMFPFRTIRKVESITKKVY